MLKVRIRFGDLRYLTIFVETKTNTMCKELQDFISNRPYHINQEDLIVDKNGNIVGNSKGALNHLVWFVNNFNESELSDEEKTYEQTGSLEIKNKALSVHELCMAMVMDNKPRILTKELHDELRTHIEKLNNETNDKP